MTVRAADPCKEDTTKSNYCLLEPLPIGTSGKTFSEYNPAGTSAADYINLMIKVFIGIIGVLGAVMIVLGGIQYMTTDAVSKKEGGKEMITNSIFGLILALASWVILNTINPHLIEIHIDPPKGVAVSVSFEDSAPKSGPATVTRNGQSVPIQSHCDQSSVDAADQDGVELTDGAAWDSVAAIHTNDDAIRSRLSTNGVSINAANCSTVGASSCTSVYKLGDSTIINLGKIRASACGSDTSCKIMVTGGTECWLHATHQIGSGNVDLAATASLNLYITGQATFPNDGQRHSKDGFSFLAEKTGQTANTTGAHWHVTLK